MPNPSSLVAFCIIAFWAVVVALLLAVRGAAVLPVFFADLVIVPVPAVAREQQVAPVAGAGGRGAGCRGRHQAGGRAQSLSGATAIVAQAWGRSRVSSGVLVVVVVVDSKPLSTTARA